MVSAGASAAGGVCGLDVDPDFADVPGTPEPQTQSLHCRGKLQLVGLADARMATCSRADGRSRVWKELRAWG